MSVDISKRTQVALDAAQDASKLIRSFADSDEVSATGSKQKVVGGESMGLVTEADLAAESAIIDRIKLAFPDDSFLAEESQTVSVDAKNLWVIDPLDGTNNFAHGIPHYSVSIAYCHNGITQCGVIANPATGELFSAEQGRGAWLNGRQVSVSSRNCLSEAIVVTGFYYDRGEMMKSTLATINDLFERNIRGIRRFGSAALDLAYVGSGRFDAFFEYYLSPWDYAAGKLFVEEAGGKISSCAGKPVGLKPVSMLATNTVLHEPLLQVTKRRDQTTFYASN